MQGCAAWRIISIKGVRSSGALFPEDDARRLTAAPCIGVGQDDCSLTRANGGHGKIDGWGLYDPVRVEGLPRRRPRADARGYSC